MRKTYSNDKDRKFYNKNGYIVYRSVLTEKECEDYIKESHRICKNNLTVTSNIYRKSKNLKIFLDKKRFYLLLTIVKMEGNTNLRYIFFWQIKK